MCTEKRYFMSEHIYLSNNFLRVNEIKSMLNLIIKHIFAESSKYLLTEHIRML